LTFMFPVELGLGFFLLAGVTKHIGTLHKYFVSKSIPVPIPTP
jgi:hypothetical protein